jgi:hypothetical protein
MDSKQIPEAKAGESLAEYLGRVKAQEMRSWTASQHIAHATKIEAASRKGMWIFLAILGIIILAVIL